MKLRFLKRNKTSYTLEKIHICIYNSLDTVKKRKMDCLQILAVVLFLHTISGYSVEKANTIQRQYAKRGGNFGTTCSFFNWRLCIPKKGKKDNVSLTIFILLSSTSYFIFTFRFFKVISLTSIILWLKIKWCSKYKTCFAFQKLT